MGRVRLASLAVMTAVACALPSAAPADVTRAAGISYVEKNFGKGGSYLKLRAPCPKGTHVLGGGEVTNAGYFTARLHHTFPYDDRDRGKAPDDGWEVRMSNVGEHHFVAYAICSKRSPKYVTKDQAVNANDQTNNNVACPAGTAATAGGHKGSKTVAENSGWSTLTSWTYFIDNASNQALPVTAYAICVKFPVAIASGMITAGPQSESFVGGTCPSDKHVVGGGLSNGAGVDQMWTNSTHPTDGGDNGSAPDDGWGAWVDNTTMNGISASAHAVCAGPLK
jgi:hypothetical protein